MRQRGGKKGSDPKVPPMKIKLIGRSGESDSPIFFAESLGENVRSQEFLLEHCDPPLPRLQWEMEGSGSERGSLKDRRSQLKGWLSPHMSSFPGHHSRFGGMWAGML